MSGEVAISVKNLSKKYRQYASVGDGIKEVFHPFRKRYHKEFWALKDVSFEIMKGESVGIIGRNGSGKSTLLQILCGVLQPTTGSVQVNGRVSALLELGAGFNPEFTGRENVYMNGVLMGLSKEEIDERMDEIIAFSELKDFIDQPVRTYSSGMYVRLAFSCAVHVEPDILVVDEALSVGDAVFQSRCYEKIKDFQMNGGTVIFITHDLPVITSLCVRAMLLDKCRVVRFGNPSEIVNHYASMTALQLDSGSGGVRAEKGQLAQSLRYGGGGAEIVHQEIVDESGSLVDVLVPGRLYRATHRVRFDRDVAQPIFGFLLKTVTGIEVCGDNTYFYDGYARSVKAGDVIDVCFEFVAELNPGVFVASVGVSEVDNGIIKALDRSMDNRAITVTGSNRYIGLMRLNSKINMVSVSGANAVRN